MENDPECAPVALGYRRNEYENVFGETFLIIREMSSYRHPQDDLETRFAQAVVGHLEMNWA
jgi:hypothetical protein